MTASTLTTTPVTKTNTSDSLYSNSKQTSTQQHTHTHAHSGPANASSSLSPLSPISIDDPQSREDDADDGDKDDAAAQGRWPRGQTSASGAAELARIAIDLRRALTTYPDFPKAGINFVDILPLFANPILHEQLIHALVLQVATSFPNTQPDIVVGLDARGFLFGPSLALRLGCGFAPVRKPGKLPGRTVEASFEKEYGTDVFALQADAITPGQNVLVVDDIIATGGSAAAAGNLVQQLGGNLIGFLFILELDFLKGRDKLQAPAATLLRDDMTD